MSSLPQGLDLPSTQNRWASILTPWLKNPMSSGVYLKNLSLVSGSNVINHKLGKTPQGWIVIDIQAAETLYRSAAFNDLTLTLTASGDVTASLYVF